MILAPVCPDNVITAPGQSTLSTTETDNIAGKEQLRLSAKF